MSGLAALLAGHTPPKVYQWHSAASVEDIKHAVEKAGWCFRYIDGWTIEDKETFLKATATALETTSPGRPWQPPGGAGPSVPKGAPVPPGGGIFPNPRPAASLPTAPPLW